MFNVSLEIDRNSTFTKEFIWKAGEPASPVNLTGCTAVMEIRPTYDGELIASLTTENNRIVLGGVLGSIKLTMADEATLLLPFGIYSYDMFVTFATGEKRKVLYGTVTINNSITLA